VDPPLDINGAHRCHRLADDRGSELREEGRDQQDQPADFFERAAGGEGFVTGLIRIRAKSGNDSVSGSVALISDRRERTTAGRNQAANE
jgi:hypothetical protein